MNDSVESSTGGGGGATPAEQRRRMLGLLFLWGVLVGIASYGIDLFGVALTLDEELQSVAAGADVVWLHQDRWGMYLLNRFVLPMPSLPYLSGLIGLLALSGVSVMVVDLWSDRDLTKPGRSLLCVTVLVSTPVLAFLMHFNTTQFGVFLGLLAGIFGLRMFVRGGPWWPIAGWALLVFGVSVYQSIAIAVAVTYGFIILNRLLRDPVDGDRVRKLLTRSLLFAAWLCTALVAHKLIAVFVRSVIPPHDGYAIIDLAYSGGLWRHYSVSAVTGYLGAFLLGEKWYLGLLSAVLIWSGVSLAMMRLVRAREISRLCVGTALLGSVVVAPFAIVILTGVGWWPARTLLGLPFLLGGLAFIALGSRFATIRLAYGVVAVLCVWHFAISNNRLMYADHQQWILDRHLMFEIARRIEERAIGEHREIRLAVVGVARSSPSVGRFQEETIGMSYFSPELTMKESGSTSIRVGKALRVFGLGPVEGIASPAEYAKALAIASVMPHWPMEGSVVVSDGLAVVNLGSPTEAQKRFAGGG